MKKHVLSKVLLVTVCLSLCLTTFAVSYAQAQSQKKVPDLLRIATYDIGSTGYVMYGFLQEAINNKFETRLRAIPIGTDLPRMQAVRDKQAQFCSQGTDFYFSAEGLDRYATRNWGPQPIRVLWIAEIPGTVAVTKGDSGIKTCADLKGKRLSWIPGSIFNLYHGSLLAFCNLTWEDVKKVQVSGFGAMMKALPEGKVDIIMTSSTSPVTYELDSSPSKIGFLQFPAANKEGWKRIQKVNPVFYPTIATYGGGLSDQHPIESLGHPYPATLAYDFLDNETAYFMTKAIHEVYSDLAKKSELMKRCWSLEKCLSSYVKSKGAIFHPGSVRYFKEIGVWKPEWDKLQEKRIQRQKALKDLWNKTVAEANSKGIKDSDFPQFWLTKHTELGSPE